MFISESNRAGSHSSVECSALENYRFEEKGLELDFT